MTSSVPNNGMATNNVIAITVIAKQDGTSGHFILFYHVPGKQYPCKKTKQPSCNKRVRAAFKSQGENGCKIKGGGR